MNTSQQVVTQEQHLELTGAAELFFVDNGDRRSTKTHYAAAVAAANARCTAGPVAAADLVTGASAAAYVGMPFKEDLTILQAPMRAAGISPAFLRAARNGGTDRSKAFGFDTGTAPHVAPPAPIEFLRVVERIKARCGDLLAGLVPFTIVCNRQVKAEDKHVPHFDPKNYRAISGVNLGQGEVTLTLETQTDGQVVHEQVLKPGTAYLLVGEAVTLLKHNISAPVGGVRACCACCACMLTRFTSQHNNLSINRPATSS